MAGESLAGKTALVTGAGRRLGRAIAMALAAEGMNLAVHYRSSAAEAEELCGALEQQGVQAWPLGADFADPSARESLIDRAIAAAGRLDLLVNSASIFPPGTLHELSLGDLTSVLQINTWTPFVLSRQFVDRVGGGKIINLLDTRVRGYDWEHAGYILSKHLLAVLTRMTAVQYAPHVTVNAVAPGLILPPPGKDQEYLDRLAHTVPLQRHGEANDIAEAVVFLARSTYITGQVIYVDGGRHLKEGLDG
jgi:pteridine reductase